MRSLSLLASSSSTILALTSAPPTPRPHPPLPLTSPQSPSPQFLIFRITDDKKHIEIEHKGEKGASFEDFTKLLPDNECRYAVLDVEIATKSGATANKLIFVAWCARHLSTRATGGKAGWVGV